MSNMEKNETLKRQIAESNRIVACTGTGVNTEIGSIIENAVEMGAKVLVWLPMLLNAMFKSVDNVSEHTGRRISMLCPDYAMMNK